MRSRRGDSRSMGEKSGIDKLASEQSGVFSIAQVRGLGFDRASVYRRIKKGEWVRLDDSVYALASAPDTWEQTLWAAVLSRPRVGLTHWTACRLLGVADARGGQPAILVPRGSNARSSIARVYESDEFDAVTMTTVGGLPVTTMPETLFLLARDTRPEILTNVFDHALVTGKLDLRAMATTIDREFGRRTPGAPLLRRLTSSRMPTAPSHSSSYLERLLEMILHDPRLPPWKREHEFSLNGVPSRVDVFVPKARLVIEADGRNWHTKMEAFDNDRRRDNALAAQGTQVLRFTYDMLIDEPDKCLEQTIATCLLRAA